MRERLMRWESRGVRLSAALCPSACVCLCCVVYACWPVSAAVCLSVLVHVLTSSLALCHSHSLSLLTCPSYYPLPITHCPRLSLCCVCVHHTE